MDDADAEPAGARAPTIEDCLKLCRALNEEGAQYLLCGGFAIIFHGYPRTTGDIHFLIESSWQNQRRVRRALEVLPEKAIRELGPDEDMREWVVVRVGDDVVVDLMTAAGGITYDNARGQIGIYEIEGVPVPMAEPRLLLQMKQTLRAKDVEDRIFLHRKIAEAERGGDKPPQ